MANTDWPSGLRPVSNGVAGTAPQMRPYPKLAGIIYEGDILYMGDSGVVVYNGTTDAHADNLIGVAAHHAATAANTGEGIFVYDDPNQEYICQSATDAHTTQALVNEAIGRHAPVVYATGNTTTLQSKLELGAVTSGWTLDTPLFVVRDWKGQDNEVGKWHKFVVKIDHRCHVATNDSVTRIT